MKTLLKFTLILVLITSCQRPTERDWEMTSLGVLFEDQAATAFIKAERFEEALNVYVDMLEKEPNKPQIHSNIAVIMAQMQKGEEALKSWQHALKLAEEKKDAAAIFALNFNLGVYYGAQKKIDEALKYYQAALDILPTSIETKTNIELLIQAQSSGGQGDGESKDQNQDQKNQKDQQNKDQKGQQKKDDKKDQQGQDDQKKQDEKDKSDGKKPQTMEGSAKYKPRPYQGDQLNEGDVKKILGELRNQEQKIRANFDKKEQKDSKNEKDW